MLKDVKQTTKHSTIYAIGNVSTKIIGLILIPIYTNPVYLTRADFGALAILEATGLILNSLLLFSISGALQRWYWEPIFISKQKSLFYTTLIFLLIVNIPIISALILYASHFSDIIFSSTDYTVLLQLTFITVGFRILNGHTLHVAILKEQPRFYTFIKILSFTLILLLTIWFVVYRHAGLKGIWQAALIGEAFVFILLLPFIYKNISWQFHYPVLKEMLSYSYPLMLSSVASLVLSVTDRYMLNFMSGLETTGIYALGLRLANTLRIVISKSVTAALAPLKMKKMNEENNQRFYSKVLTYTAFMFIIFLLALALFSLEILQIFTRSPEYWQANYIIPILSFAFLFGFMRSSIKIGLVIKKQTKVMGTFVVLSGIINVGLNYVLIPVFDMYGAALATVISQIFYLSSIYYYSQKAYPIPYEWRKIFTLVLLSLIIVITGIILNPVNVFIRVPVKLAMLAGLPFILHLFNFYDKIELENIKRIFKDWRNPKLLAKSFVQFFK